jgi:hypothetical protein
MSREGMQRHFLVVFTTDTYNSDKHNEGEIRQGGNEGVNQGRDEGWGG